MQRKMWKQVETIVKIHVELEAKVNMNAKKIGDMIVKIQYPCQAWARGEWKHQCRDKCKDPCQGESKEKDECKEKCG